MLPCHTYGFQGRPMARRILPTRRRCSLRELRGVPTVRMEPISLYDYEERARQVMPHNDWVFVEAGAMDERTTARNRTAFEALTLRPRFLRDTTERKISTTVLGNDISFPVMISPADSHLNAHPEAERATARGAGMSGSLMMWSTSYNWSMEEIAPAAAGPPGPRLCHR
ncbi:MAG: alpha-hydroxy-acid oxidizing protein, partial [Chloroflexi bacterium]|nr:alpha-hydroxy-acid oxidizing protein [Chloroflexota bacterium]